MNWRKTPTMLVASNTSPISNLAIIGLLHLLRSQFPEVCIPEAVHLELGRLKHAAAGRAIDQAIQEGWLKITPLRDRRVAGLLSAHLDQGEAEAIALSIEIPAELLLLDERDGRAAAAQSGLRVTGVMGILLRAKRDGQIPAVKPALEQLRTQAHFFVSASLERGVLELAGE